MNAIFFVLFTCGQPTHFLAAAGDGYRFATKIKYKCRQCNDCGHWWRTGVKA